MNDVLTLINVSFTTDEIGNDKESIVEADVFCEVTSAGRAEFFSAAQAGLRPEYKFKIWAFDYDGQTKVRYDGREYDIYRTFKSHDIVELYAKAVTANNG